MKNRFTFSPAFGVFLALVVAAAANAQQPFPGAPIGPYPNPTVSPYLNLQRRGNSAALNYYGLVRPQIEMRNNIQNLRQRADNPLDLGDNGDSANGLPVTGHAAVFLNTGSYFLNSGAGQRGRGQGVGGANQTRQPPQGPQGPATPPPTRGASSFRR